MIFVLYTFDPLSYYFVSMVQGIFDRGIILWLYLYLLFVQIVIRKGIIVCQFSKTCGHSILSPSVFVIACTNQRMTGVRFHLFWRRLWAQSCYLAVN